MNEANAESPRRKARLAGLFYALNIVTGSLSLFFAGRGLATYGDAANLVAAACYLVVTLLFYELFRPVSRSVSLIAACFSLVGCVLSVLAVFGASPGISPLAFFGAYCLLIGYLILRSAFLPAVLGILMMIGGLGWLTFLSPTLAGQLKPFNLLPGVIGETVLTVWLLVKGVVVQRWWAQASTSSP
jgi:hypothetical protein